MLISISGPQGIGKSFAARILGYAFPAVHVVNGDDYILREEKRFEKLKDDIHFVLAQGADVVFEHVSAQNVLEKLRLSPDLVVYILPEESSDFADRVEADTTDNLVKRLYRSFQEVSASGIAAYRVASSEEAIAKVVRHLQAAHGRAKLSTFILKIASRCNLACNYCYMYEGADDSWKRAPVSMSQDVVKDFCRQINDHYRNQSVKKCLSIVLHGGEPLSIGRKRLLDIIDTIRTDICSEVEYNIGIQTNGTLIDDRLLCELDQRCISVGLSLDGFSESANSRRNFLGGASSLQKSLKAIDVLKNHNFTNGSFGGVLAVLGSDGDGKEFYQEARRRGVRAIDLLFEGSPDWQRASQNKDCSRDLQFLIDVFDSWACDEEPIRVRLFESIISRVLGKNWNVDSLGFAPISLLGISVEGEWEFLDCLRHNVDGSWRSPFKVSDSSIATVLNSDEAYRVHRNRYRYDSECVECKYFKVCGAGYLPHRFQPGNGYANKSENCAALFGIIDHVAKSLKVELAD